ncbi:MAG: UvrD-helicase domain-containing protein [Oscillospiraceae bacterium]|nr:UvrD-helicase domain-containing protein [Oscillospiraceae bacterium]
MYIALDKEQKRISISDAVQGDTFFCPVCLEKMFVKSGTERARHFSHYPNCECNDSWNGQYDMSDWHYGWQNQFPPENQEVVVQCDDIRHRADVLTDRTVVEFQHSPLSSGKFNDRNVFYHGNIGYKVVWLYDMREDYEQELITESAVNQFAWSKPRSTFRKYNLRAGEIDLFFQIADEGECILHIQAFTNDGFLIKCKYTKDAFLEYVGLINGVCPLPLHLDMQIDEVFRTFSEKYKIRLNPQQQRAVQAVSGANLMIAVPGSGKTTVMVARMGYMIYCKKIAPENILAITYTVSATNDIKRRFAEKFDPEIAKRLNVRTINSLCEQVINKYVQIHQRTRFTMLKANEQANIIKSIYIALTGDQFPHEADLIAAQTVISYIKNMMMTTAEQRAEYLHDEPFYEEFFNKYVNTLKSQQRMDFDDQLIYARSILIIYADVLAWFQAQYQYICVDEAQDTSKIQHEIIRILASKHNNIFMVGDEDQSIYRFRAAYPRALLDFTDTYTNPYILFLETNYRSTKPIVSAAQRFISQNINRHSEKHMVASRGDGKPIERITVRKKHQQYSAIAEISKKEHGQMAVLYRNNGSAIPLMDLFLRESIPFVRLKEAGENFFTSKVVQDIVYFLRFAINLNDAEAFNQVYYKCGYGFKKNAAYWSCRKATQKRITIADELINQMSQWPTLMRKAEDFRNKFKKIAASKPHDAIDLICRFWYYAYAKEKELDIGKVDILYALAVHEETIKGFLARLEQLPQLIESYKCTEENPVILSTIHSAKGLEFDTVYIVDVYDGCLPHSCREDAPEQERVDTYEEERRLFYVGITRAKNELHLFYVSECASEFVNSVAPPDRTAREPVIRHPDVQIKEPKMETKPIQADSDLAPYTVNTRIKHATYGEGIIVGLETIRDDIHVIEVQFDNGSKSKLQLEVVVRIGSIHLV